MFVTRRLNKQLRVNALFADTGGVPARPSTAGRRSVVIYGVLRKGAAASAPFRADAALKYLAPARKHKKRARLRAGAGRGGGGRPGPGARARPSVRAGPASMEQLIAAVRCYPCLWNTTAIEYRDQELKDAAWAEVMKETNLSSEAPRLVPRRAEACERDASSRGAGAQELPVEVHVGHGVPAAAHVGAQAARRRAAARRRPRQRARRARRARRRRAQRARRADDSRADRSSDDSSDAGSSPKRQSSQLTAQGKRRVSEGAWRRGRSPPAPAPDPLDIFFNSMCQSTKRFPYPAQLKVKRALFEAVMAGEEALLAEQQSYASLWARAASASSSDDAGAAAS
ncbi:hypothetical protein MSG28_012923 [Choristoneura fumiferana]|uniref:Uncharacterized protein n=1 Tax=Choristoneura fumiferana TaxID=7141 RepID=A0ACC0KS85_CHOFU|nr:hypothetical protein MSG28_012923 [Choristoneura fumiferana]